MGSNLGATTPEEVSYPLIPYEFELSSHMCKRHFTPFVCWVVFPSFSHFPSDFWFFIPWFFRCLYILGMLSTWHICLCYKDFLSGFQLSLTLHMLFCHSNAFKIFYVVQFTFLFFFASGFWILFRKCLPMQRLSGIQLWFLLVCVWFNSFNISPWSNWNLLLCDLKYRCIFVCFHIADHLLQKNLLVCFSPSGLRCYFYDTLNFHMYMGLFLSFL